MFGAKFLGKVLVITDVADLVRSFLRGGSL
jgi:hypothetical protein